MPINSVITNSNAMMALRHLNDTNRQMAETQGRISTGLKINNAIDDSSNYTIAQGLRSDVKAMSTISQGLNNTKGAAQVALAGANSVSNLLADVRAKLVEMSNEGISASQRSILATLSAQIVHCLGLARKLGRWVVACHRRLTRH